MIIASKLPFPTSRTFHLLRPFSTINGNPNATKSNVKVERKASMSVRFFAFWLRASSYIGGAVILGTGILYISEVISPIWEQSRLAQKGKQAIDPSEPVDPEDVDGLIDFAVDRLKANAKEMAIVGDEIQQVSRQRSSHRGHVEKPKITWVHDENGRVVEKIISALVRGSSREVTIETCLMQDGAQWRLNRIQLKVPGTRYVGQVFSTSDIKPLYYSK